MVRCWLNQILTNVSKTGTAVQQMPLVKTQLGHICASVGEATLETQDNAEVSSYLIDVIDSELLIHIVIKSLLFDCMCLKEE